jgi:hypothetical protein
MRGGRQLRKKRAIVPLEAARGRSEKGRGRIYGRTFTVSARQRGAGVAVRGKN